MSSDNSGPLASTAEASGGSSKKVTELGTPNGKKSFPHQNSDMNSQCHSGGQGVGSAQSKGKMSGNIISPRNQQSSGSSNPHGSTVHLSGRKAQLMNGNHLLNFHYDPISRPQHQPRAPPPRRQQKRRPYNKDLFLQANYKFVVLDSGNYTPESMDPDKMLKWEDIICVRYSTPFLYLLMGEEDHKGNSWKRCPLCFVMISPKDLYTIYIENVKQSCVSDTIEFMLLTRQKDSFTLSYKNKQETDIMPCHSDEIYDPFSKFTFTSDVDLSVRKAISDLDSWLVRADSGLVDDLEKLPYACAAMEQLEQRKKYWNDHRACDSNKSFKITDYEACGFSHETVSTDVNDQIKWSGNLIPDKSNGGAWFDQTKDESELLEGQDSLQSSSYDERHSNDFGGAKDKNSYNFYQAADGQHLILHPLNMKCLLHHYGSYDLLPHRISGRILQLETVTQSEAMRRRYRYLSHFSLTTTFQFCEIDLSEILPSDALYPFMDEIKKRENQRKQLVKKVASAVLQPAYERREKIKAEAAAAAYTVPVLYSFGQSSHNDSPTFSLDDFEALGSSPMTSSSPPIVGERKLFSNVTRLGFAAAHDSPSLKIQEPNPLPDTGVTSNPSGIDGSKDAGTPSFANIISREKSVETLDGPKMIELGRKGKKPSRVLLSTAGGRRY
uniref:RING finger protein 10 n=1 Tax=Fagus sylvatica TaxID=28930 RepID=A0A2N9GSE1_FAGSY